LVRPTFVPFQDERREEGDEEQRLVWMSGWLDWTDKPLGARVADESIHQAIEACGDFFLTKRSS